MRDRSGRGWRKRPLIMLGAALVLLLLAACVSDATSDVAVTLKPTQFAANGEAAPTVVVIGDSISTGYQTSAEDAWPTRLQQKLSAEGNPITLVNAAENGAGYLVEGDGGKTFEQQAATAVPSQAQLVVVYGSENDIGADLGQISAQVENTATAVKAKAPQATLLFVGPAAYGSDVDPDLLSIRDQIKAGAQGVGAEFVDPIEEHWIMDDKADLIGPDGDHPTVAGHVYLEQKFEALVTPLLLSN